MQTVDILDPFCTSKTLFFVAGEIFKLLNYIYRFRPIIFMAVRGGLKVIRIDTGASGPGSNPCLGHSVVFLGTAPPPPVPAGTGEFYVGRVGVQILLVASCY